MNSHWCLRKKTLVKCHDCKVTLSWIVPRSVCHSWFSQCTDYCPYFLSSEWSTQSELRGLTGSVFPWSLKEKSSNTESRDKVVFRTRTVSDLNCRERCPVNFYEHGGEKMEVFGTVQKRVGDYSFSNLLGKFEVFVSLRVSPLFSTSLTRTYNSDT